MIKWKNFLDEEPIVGSRIVIKNNDEYATCFYVSSRNLGPCIGPEFHVDLDILPDDSGGGYRTIYCASWCYLEEFLKQIEQEGEAE